MFAWIFFRVESVSHAFSYIAEIFSRSLFTFPKFPNMTDALVTLLFIVLFMIIEWIGRERQYAISHVGYKWPKPFKWIFYYCIIVVIYIFAGTSQEFIYFQF